MMRHVKGWFLIPIALPLMAAQQASRNQWGYDFPASYDAEIAAPSVHRVRYSDDRIMLMEVANPPGYPMQMHGHPYPSVFARSSGSTHLGGGGPSDQYMEPRGGRNGEHWHSASPPTGTPSLECTAADPQAPHRPVNHGSVPQHFYRIEFKRIDEDPQISSAAVRAAPTERQLYEDSAVRLIEVRLHPEGRTSIGPYPFPAVLAFDDATSFDAIDRALARGAGRSLPPTGLAMPRCMTVSAGMALSFFQSARNAVHYYQLDFKRIEGDALKNHWRDWYPYMTSMH